MMGRFINQNNFHGKKIFVPEIGRVRIMELQEQANNYGNVLLSKEEATLLFGEIFRRRELARKNWKMMKNREKINGNIQTYHNRPRGDAD
jgi:hypothetical protein